MSGKNGKMQAKTIMLTSGSDTQHVRDTMIELIRRAPENKVLILNLAHSDLEKLSLKGHLLTRYLTELGARTVSLIDPRTTTNDALGEFNNTGMLYLPGGNTVTFARNLRARGQGYEQALANFPGIVAGNSAGAYVLGQHYFDLHGAQAATNDMLGLLPFSIKAHYNPILDTDLRQLSNQETIYAIADGSSLEVSGGKVYAAGQEVWAFNKGEKTEKPRGVSI